MSHHSEDVLDFWFGTTAESPTPAESARWFRKDDAFDARIRQQFGDTLGAARAGALQAWTQTPRGWLALLIVLDQFPRNIHRGSAQAFASDAQAQEVALEGLARGDDLALQPIQRVFCYMPLEHAEDPVLQRRNVELFTALRDSVDAAQRARFAGFLKFACQHQALIQQFGRFPHRNAALGRASSAAEEAWLAQPGAGF